MLSNYNLFNCKKPTLLPKRRLIYDYFIILFRLYLPHQFQHARHCFFWVACPTMQTIECIYRAQFPALAAAFHLAHQSGITVRTRLSIAVCFYLCPIDFPITVWAVFLSYHNSPLSAKISRTDCIDYSPAVRICMTEIIVLQIHIIALLLIVFAPPFPHPRQDFPIQSKSRFRLFVRWCAQAFACNIPLRTNRIRAELFYCIGFSYTDQGVKRHIN